MGAPVFQLHHLLLPGTQAPSLGADGEYAIVLHAHLVQLSVVKLCSLCPQLQVNLLVTWKEEGPGRGVQRRRSEAPQSEQTRGISEPRMGEQTEAPPRLSISSSPPPIWQAVPCMDEQTWLCWSLIS